jgi:CheY-like chemotaxis protein
MLASLLERLDFAIAEAVDGADALRVIEQDPPDLVLTDLDMPVMDGLRLVRRLRQMPIYQRLPVIVFSTRGSDEDRKNALSAGANAYMVKAAFSAGELHRVLQRYLFTGESTWEMS